MPESSPEVTIYVRRGSDSSERVISFALPDGIDPLELLDHGFALDGNQAAATIALNLHGDPVEFMGPFGAFGVSLTDALAEVQRSLVKYLRERGFQPRFA